MSYHRLLTHRGYKTHKWVEYFLTICGTLALEGGPIFWVATHRIHHQKSDHEGDPHTPREGTFWAHMGWILTGEATAPRHRGARALRARSQQGHVPRLALQRGTGCRNVVVGLALLAFGGIPYVLWGIFFRTTFGLHATWLVNSATHLWGSRRFKTRDDSTNNWWVALLTFGEGWHNNHHAHPVSARHGLAWYELDLNWIGISTLQAARPGLGHQGRQDRAAGAVRRKRPHDDAEEAVARARSVEPVRGRTRRPFRLTPGFRPTLDSPRMPVTRRQKAIAFFVALCVLLVAAAVSLNIGWILINGRRARAARPRHHHLRASSSPASSSTRCSWCCEIRRNEEHDSFINAVTHELKTPIASIRLYLETLQSRDVERRAAARVLRHHAGRRRPAAPHRRSGAEGRRRRGRSRKARRTRAGRHGGAGARMRRHSRARGITSQPTPIALESHDAATADRQRRRRGAAHGR